MKTPRHWLFILFLLMIPGCAAVPTDPHALEVYRQNNDPLEPLNRQIFAFNRRADEYVMRPISKGYRAITTETVRKNVRTFFANLRTPVTIINDILQFDLKKAGQSLSRFTINSTLGFFGIFDVADRLGIAPHTQSFGNTLGIWGVPSGPYLIIPILGPSNARDFTGLLTDIAFDPFTYAAASHNRKTLTGIFLSLDALDAVAKYEGAADLLEDTQKTSIDFYASMRSMYSQHRKAAIDAALGKTKRTDTKASYEFSLDDFDDDEDLDE